MHKPLLASLLLAPLATACTTDDRGTASGPGPGPGPIVMPAAGCTTAVPDTQVVVGCDFGPSVHPFAVSDGRLYAVSGGTFSAIDLASSAKTRLFRYEFTSFPAALAAGTVVQDGRLYMPGNVVVDGGVMSALLSVDAIAPTPDDVPTVVTWFERYHLQAPMFGDGEHLYAESTVHEDFSAFSGPVVAIGYDGDDLAPRSPRYGMPIGLADDTLYYLHGRTLERMPKTGGTAEVLATDLSDASFHDRAVDADHAYTTTAAAPFELRRFGANGVNEVVATAHEGNPEVPMSPPHDLRRDGDWLYFLQDVGGEGSRYRALQRVPADGSGEIEAVVSGEDLTPPVFDGDGLYVAYTRGGVDEPIEGVVVRIAN
ncbi:MAG: hypothetical protein SFX73_19355 [Kofleriaceae bacterium]|nr:hypothetical protein [Kofleriaceae bacterium]